MKNYFLLLLLWVAGHRIAAAQENPINNGIGFGFQLNQYHRDFGLGLSFTSPQFLHDKVAVRLRGNLMYLEHLKQEEITWTPYSNVSAGLAGTAGMIGESIRLYGEGGILALFPSPGFSENQVVFGGYGLFGFEFFMQKSFNYFLEIGGVGTGASAEKIPRKPIYSNGLTISTGFRVYLP